MNKFRYLLLLLCVMTVVGCGESAFPVPSGKGNIRAINAAVTAPDVTFLIEERSIGLTRFKQSTVLREYDDLQYSFNFDYHFSGDAVPTRLVSTPLDMAKNTDYIVIFTGSLDAPGSLTWDNPVRKFDDTDTVMEVWFGHLSPELGEVDVYFESTGTLPAAGAARATLSYEDRSPIFELQEGLYDFFITSKDDPNDILFQSQGITYIARVTYLVSAFDSDPSITSPISARIITDQGAAVEVANISAPPTLRTFHSSITTGPFDLYRDGDFSTPLHTNVNFAETSATVSTPADEATYTFTDAGNVGSILLEQDIALFDGHRTTRFLVGSAPDTTTLLTVDNLRQVDDRTKLRFIHTSANQLRVDIYLVEAGEDVEDSLPSFFDFVFLGDTGYLNIIENDYEVYVTENASKTVLAGPFAFTATNGDIVHIAIVDNVDPNLVDIINYDHISLAP